MRNYYNRPRRPGGIMDTLVQALNEEAEANGEEGRWERQYTEPTMECGDGRWRTLDGRFCGKDGGKDEQLD